MDVIKEYWGLVLAAVGYVVWLARLEGMVNSNIKEIERLESRLEKQRAEDMEYNRSHREEVKNTLKSIQDDIKVLLQRRD
jgi:hypothetical protein